MLSLMELNWTERIGYEQTLHAFEMERERSWYQGASSWLHLPRNIKITEEKISILGDLFHSHSIYFDNILP